jgi:hypothetical protein
VRGCSELNGNCGLKNAFITAMRKLLRLLGVKQLEFLGRSAARTLNEVNREIRRRKAGSQVIAGITSFDGTEKLKTYVFEDHPPWLDIVVERSQIPGMVSQEERQYYN